MAVLVKIQHLSATREIEIDPLATINDLKQRIEEIYNIPAAQQTLLLGNRNISTCAKQLHEIGLTHGSKIIVKRIHKFTGQQKRTDMNSLMKNPMIKNMMKNPETIKSIQEMFPDLKEELSQNKTLNMMINSGGLEEEIEKMSLDSDYMNTQMRNADLTMAKLENIPGGINMMSGMMKEVEDPFQCLMGTPKLNSGHVVTERTRSAIPGKSKRNLLVEYRKQLSEMKQIGFEDSKKNIDALERVGGDLEAALDLLVTEAGMSLATEAEAENGYKVNTK